MRLCRFRQDGVEHIGFYYGDGIVPVAAAAEQAGIDLPAADLMEYAAHGRYSGSVSQLWSWIDEHTEAQSGLLIAEESVELRAPVDAPPKILLLAGNYAAHIEEEGRIALERAETFPYVFMKPHTALNHPNAEIRPPKVSPDHVDYECELGVVIGKRAKNVSEEEALGYVAGYTVLNDISDRQYKPFPDRKPRDRDAFFDWLHGKWHDGFCPIGPCLASAETISDPQALGVQLSVNGDVRQQGSTAQMIFPVAAIVAFLSQSMTLVPGDIIATGTPAGVGATTGTYLKPGDVIEASIEGIGTLRSRIGTPS